MAKDVCSSVLRPAQDVHPPGLRALDRAPRRRQEEVDRPIAIDVAHSRRVEPERLSLHLAGPGSEQRTGLPRKEIDLATARRRAAVLPGANDDVVVAVAVHVTGV